MSGINITDTCVYSSNLLLDKCFLLSDKKIEIENK